MVVDVSRTGRPAVPDGLAVHRHRPVTSPPTLRADPPEIAGQPESFHEVYVGAVRRCVAAAPS